MNLERATKLCHSETISRFRVGKHLSDMFPVNNKLKNEMFYRYCFQHFSEYPIRTVQANQDGLKLNGKHRVLVCTDNINILGGSLRTVKVNAETSVLSSQEFGLEVNGD